jgi:hypothetical protein
MATWLEKDSVHTSLGWKEMYVHTAYVDIIWVRACRCQQVKYQCSAKNKRRFKHDPMSNHHLCMGGACYVGYRTPIILRKKFSYYH